MGAPVSALKLKLRVTQHKLAELSRATQATIDRKADALFRSTRTDFPVGWSNYPDGAICGACPHP